MESKSKIISILKNVGIWILTVISVIILGTFLISIIYIINPPSLEENLSESREVLAKESSHYMIGDDMTSTLDNQTDAHMMLIASYRGDESLIDKGMNNYRVYREGKSAYEQVAFEDNESPTRIISYYRYWHGYILFLRPLLAFFNYGQIRIINTIMHILILGIVIFLMIKNKLYKYIIPLLSVYILMNPVAMFKSLQNSTIWYIICISLIAYMLLKNKLIKYKCHYLLFTIIGMITSYMDFLTYPIATLGVLLIFVLVSEDLSFKEQIKRILLCGICWTLGYGIMWASKWVLATIIIGKDVIQNATEAITLRSSSLNASSVELSRLEILKSTLLIFKNKIALALIILNVTIFLILFVKKIVKEKITITNFVCTLPVLSVGLVSIVWYLVLANHTSIHPFLAFRTAYPLWLAIFTWLYKLTECNKNVDTK